jgi:hypothetical protein
MEAADTLVMQMLGNQLILSNVTFARCGLLDVDGRSSQSPGTARRQKN